MKLGPDNKVNSASYCLNIPKQRIYNSIYNVWPKQSPNTTETDILNAGYLQAKRRCRHHKPRKYGDSNYTARKLQPFHPTLNIWGNEFQI